MLLLQRALDCEGRRTHTNICGMDCACALAANFSCYNNRNVFCSRMMNNGIIRSLCYHKYNLRKACVGPVSFIWERVSYSGEAVSSIRRKRWTCSSQPGYKSQLCTVWPYTNWFTSLSLFLCWKMTSFPRPLCDHMHKLTMWTTKHSYQ